MDGPDRHVLLLSLVNQLGLLDRRSPLPKLRHAGIPRIGHAPVAEIGRDKQMVDVDP